MTEYECIWWYCLAHEHVCSKESSLNAAWHMKRGPMCLSSVQEDLCSTNNEPASAHVEDTSPWQIGALQHHHTYPVNDELWCEQIQFFQDSTLTCRDLSEMVPPFLGCPLNDIDSPQASDMSATFHHQSWSCKIEYASYGSHAERNKTDPNIKNTKPLRVLTKALFTIKSGLHETIIYIKCQWNSRESSFQLVSANNSVTPSFFAGEFTHFARHRVSALGTEASRESTIEAGEASEKETREVPLSHFSRNHQCGTWRIVKGPANE